MSKYGKKTIDTSHSGTDHVDEADLQLHDGDADDSIAQQLRHLDAIHDVEGHMAEDGARHAEEVGVKPAIGGHFTYEALRQHNTRTIGPRWAGKGQSSGANTASKSSSGRPVNDLKGHGPQPKSF
jgi:hypothetical protein